MFSATATAPIRSPAATLAITAHGGFRRSIKIGLSFGAMHSARRGRGSDVAGSRPYVPGDDVKAIDEVKQKIVSGEIADIPTTVS